MRHESTSTYRGGAPGGDRYARYLDQAHRLAELLNEVNQATAYLEHARTLRKVHSAHQEEMYAHCGAKLWRWGWPFSTRRQRRAVEAVRGAMKDAEEASRAVSHYSEVREQLSKEYAEALAATEELRTQWQAEQEARERYEAGQESRDYAEQRLFNEFQRQDYKAAQGPEGRRSIEAMRRFRAGKPARTSEERAWYEEWYVCQAEDQEEALERQAQERRREEESPF